MGAFSTSILVSLVISVCGSKRSTWIIGSFSPALRLQTWRGGVEEEGEGAGEERGELFRII